MLYLDENRLLRLGSRLEFSDFLINENHPITLPKNSWLTTLTVHKERIVWKNIIERSPWWGGFYERLVKSVKECLHKVLGKALLNYDEMMTVLTEIEAVLNLHPLSYVYGESDEPTPLTPMHFLNYGQHQQ